MKISVIIPTYNEEKNIENCISSLLGQDYKEFEVIVIDDGSTDKTLEILRRIKKKYSTLKIFKQKHKGAGSARNYAVKKAKGEILVFVDADMEFDKSFLKYLVRPIVEGKTIGTFSKEEYLANKGNIWAVCWNLNRGLPKDRMHPASYPNTQKVFRAILKSEFIKAGGFNEKQGYTDDWSLSERLDKEAVNAAKAIFYHKNPGSLKEIFIQSRWMAKRKYKLGFLGYLIALLRVSLPTSVLLGLVFSIRYKTIQFLLFKIIFDLGAFLGIIEYWLFSKVSK